MARSANNAAYSAYLPHNWRVMTAAGATTLGLACGLVQPALGEWWKLARSEKPSQMAPKPAPVANGFEGTIRRLLAESQHAAEQGDQRKAIQLAERAAKISEAAAQVVGPAGACSPQETSRFLAEMRTRNSTPPAVAAAPVFVPAAVAQRAVDPIQQQLPNQKTAAPARGSDNPAQVRRDSLPRTQGAESKSTFAQPGIRPSASSEPAIANRSNAAASPTSRPSGVSNPKPDSSLASNEQPSDGPGLFGTPQLPAPGARSSELNARLEDRPATRQPGSSAGAVGSPRGRASQGWIAVDETTITDELLVQSRQAAAAGHLDRAIELADQAIASTPTPSLFGPAEPSSASSEAVRWREHLIASKEAQPKSDAVVFERPVKVAARQKKPVTSPTATAARQDFTPASGLPASASGWTSISDSNPVGTVADVSSAAADSASITPSPSVTTASNTDEDPFWSEDLPPAPAPQPRIGASPIKFSRSVISRSGVWVNADSIESAPKSKDSRASVEPVPANSPLGASLVPEESDAAMPEFPIRAASDHGIPVNSPQVATAADAKVAAPTAIRGAMARTANQSEPIPQDRRFNQIQQVSAQAPETERSATSRTSRPTASQQSDAKPQRRDNEANHESSRSSNDSRPVDWNDADDSVDAVRSDESPAAGNTPTERFPVQRVLRLRQRLSSASSSDKRVETRSKSEENLDRTWQSIPSDEAADSRTPVKVDARPSASAPTDARSSALPAAGSAVITQKRPPLKLRERTRPQLDSLSSLAPHSSTEAPNSANQPRKPVVAHSELVEWKSADTLEMPIRVPAMGDSAAQLPSEPPAQTSYFGLAHSADRTDGVSSTVHPFSETSHDYAVQPGLVPPIAQVGFESTESLPGGSALPAKARDPKQSELATSAPLPPTVGDESPWHRDETRQQPTTSTADIVVHKSSFATIDRMAEALALPVSTMVSLIGGAGFALVGCGLLCLRSAMRKRHSD